MLTPHLQKRMLLPTTTVAHMFPIPQISCVTSYITVFGSFFRLVWFFREGSSMQTFGLLS